MGCGEGVRSILVRETCRNMEALKSMVCLVNCKKADVTGCAIGDKSGKLNRNYFKNDLERQLDLGGK